MLPGQTGQHSQQNPGTRRVGRHAAREPRQAAQQGAGERRRCVWASPRSGVPRAGVPRAARGACLTPSHALHRVVPQDARVLDSSLRGLGKRLDRLISSMPPPHLDAWLPAAGSRPPLAAEPTPPSAAATAAARRGQGDASPLRRTPSGASTPRRAPSDASAARTSSRDEDSGDEEELHAKLDVYLIGQQCTRKGGSSTPTRSVLSKSQRLAEQMFGVRTTYKVTSRRDGAKRLPFGDGQGTEPAEQPDRFGVGQESTAEPVLRATARREDKEGKSVKVPTLRLDNVHPESGHADDGNPPPRPHTARFATITRPGTSRVDTVRLSELASRPVSASWSRPRVYEPAVQQESGSLRLNFDQLERAWLRQSTKVQSARTRTGCRSMSRGFALLQQPPANSDRSFALGSVDVPTQPIRAPIMSKHQNRSAQSGPARVQTRTTSSAEQCVAPDDELVANPYWQIDFGEEIRQRNLRSVGKDRERSCEGETIASSPAQSNADSKVPCAACDCVRVARGCLLNPPAIGTWRQRSADCAFFAAMYLPAPHFGCIAQCTPTPANGLLSTDTEQAPIC